MITQGNSYIHGAAEQKVLDQVKQSVLEFTKNNPLHAHLSHYFNGGWTTRNPAVSPPLVALALHLVSFGNNPANNTVSNDIEAPKTFFEKVARTTVIPFVAPLQPWAIILDCVRDLIAKQPLIPTTTASNQTLTSTSNSVNLQDALRVLEQFQIGQLTLLDKHFKVSDMVRCITWIVELREAEEYVIAPFTTCIPDTNFHVMYYTIFSSTNTRTLKVVVDNFLVEIPFEVQVPANLDALTVVIIAIPTIDKTVEPNQVQGVKIMLYADPLFELQNPNVVPTDPLPTTTLSPNFVPPSTIATTTNNMEVDQTTPINTRDQALSETTTQQSNMLIDT